MQDVLLPGSMMARGGQGCNAAGGKSQPNTKTPFQIARMAFLFYLLNITSNCPLSMNGILNNKQ